MIETIRFYADNGDLLSASFILMIFYEPLINFPIRDSESYGQDVLNMLKQFDANDEKSSKYEKFIDRILTSFLDHL